VAKGHTINVRRLPRGNPVALLRGPEIDDGSKPIAMTETMYENKQMESAKLGRENLVKSGV